MNHTQGKLAANADRIESEKEHGWANDGWIIAKCEGPDAFANTRRLVACWNALEGISTEALEDFPLAINGVANIAALKQERDELKAENERLRKDSKRYRWLCEQDDGSDIQVLSVGEWVKPAICIALTFQEGKEHIDGSIDAAMKERNDSPAQEDEPVGYVDQWGNLWGASQKDHQVGARPLYTHPDQSRLRKDAERYRFIKSHSICELNDFGVDLELYVPTESLDDQLDAAIDAAMKEEK